MSEVPSSTSLKDVCRIASAHPQAKQLLRWLWRAHDNAFTAQRERVLEDTRYVLVKGTGPERPGSGCQVALPRGLARGPGHPLLNEHKG